MTKLLVSLHSHVDSKGALGIFDSENGLIYLQIDELSNDIKQHQFRGVAVLGSRIFAVTTASLRLYTLKPSDNQPWFMLEKEIVLPEWLAGDVNQANLLPLYLSVKKQLLFVGCNNLATIDTFDLDGNLINRKHLSQISKDDFKYSKRKNHPYGHIRHITESPTGDILITVALRSGLDYGSLVNVDTGEVVIDKLETPHGGVFSTDRFYYLNVSKGMILAHKQKGGVINDIDWKNQPKVHSGDYSVNVRGITYVNGTIYSSVMNFEKDKHKWIPSQIIACDAVTGIQSFSESLPDFQAFRHPRVFSIEGLDVKPQIPVMAQPLIYRHGLKISPTQIVQAENRQEISQIRPCLKLEMKSEEVGNSFSLKMDSESEKVSNSQSQKVDSEAEEVSNSLFSKVDSEPGEISNKLCSISNNNQRDAGAAISMQNVSLSYLRGAFFGFGKKRHLRKRRVFWALKDLSLEIMEGEVVGLIGRNGSGKSTLGMLIGGSLTPDKGIININGKAQLLSLGVGFRGELTGRDNVLINGTLLGLSRKQVKGSMGEIESFSELGEFMDEPVQTYSAGMKSRLAFAVATAVEPDILVLDEVLSTGDLSFRKKAENRMRTMQEKAKTILMVSHNASQLRKLCSRVIWLENGRIMMDGESKSVLAEYNHFCQNPEKWLQRQVIAHHVPGDK